MTTPFASDQLGGLFRLGGRGLLCRRRLPGGRGFLGWPRLFGWSGLLGRTRLLARQIQRDAERGGLLARGTFGPLQRLRDLRGDSLRAMPLSKRTSSFDHGFRAGGFLLLAGALAISAPLPSWLSTTWRGAQIEPKCKAELITFLLIGSRLTSARASTPVAEVVEFARRGLVEAQLRPAFPEEFGPSGWAGASCGRNRYRRATSK